MDDLADPPRFARAVLDIADVLQFGQSLDELRPQIDAGSGGEVVEHDRDANGRIDRAKVLQQLVRPRQRVVRRGDHDAVGPQGFGFAGVLHDFALRPR